MEQTQRRQQRPHFNLQMEFIFKETVIGERLLLFPLLAENSGHDETAARMRFWADYKMDLPHVCRLVALMVVSFLLDRFYQLCMLLF